jgi:hypothetical protein
MKLRTVSLVFVLSLGLPGSNTFSANAKKPQTPSPIRPAKVSEAELADRFNQTLDKALFDPDVCVSTDAARRLDALVKTAAANIVRGKHFNRVTEAEKNIGTLADALIKLGDKSPDGQTRITPDTIERALKRRDNTIAITVDPVEGRPKPTGGGNHEISICPLFPFC